MTRPPVGQVLPTKTSVLYCQQSFHRVCLATVDNPGWRRQLGWWNQFAALGSLENTWGTFWWTDTRFIICTMGKRINKPWSQFLRVPMKRKITGWQPDLLTRSVTWLHSMSAATFIRTWPRRRTLRGPVEIRWQHLTVAWANGTLTSVLLSWNHSSWYQ